MAVESIKKRDGRLVPFDVQKIADAITKAFDATYRPGNEQVSGELAQEVLSILELVSS